MDLLLFDGHSFELQCLGNCNAVCIKNKNFFVDGWLVSFYISQLIDSYLTYKGRGEECMKKTVGFL